MPVLMYLSNSAARRLLKTPHHLCKASWHAGRPHKNIVLRALSQLVVPEIGVPGSFS